MIVLSAMKTTGSTAQAKYKISLTNVVFFEHPLSQVLGCCNVVVGLGWLFHMILVPPDMESPGALQASCG